MTKCSGDLTTLERRKQWVKALRSGEYKQCKEALRRIDDSEPGELPAQAFCCLGVACDLFREDLNLHWEGGYIFTENEEIETEGTCDFMPLEVQQHLGFDGADARNPRLHNPASGSTASTCAGLNDDGLSFEAIADEIERLYILPFEKNNSASEQKP